MADDFHDTRLTERRNPRSSTIDTASVAATPWSPTGSWTQRTIDFGAINHTITAGRMLRLEIIVVDTSGDDLWFAYDTTTYTARLHITG